MPFFDTPPDDQLPRESVRAMQAWLRLTGSEQASPTLRSYGRSPRILEARVHALEKLHVECRFPRHAKFVAAMLIAHGRRCTVCFTASRMMLQKLGFDESAMDAMCAHPESLPLDERDRQFVHYALRMGLAPADLTAKDFREMADVGFSREEVQEIVGFAAFWVMNTIFSTSANVGLAGD